jgi:branched-chain amino acid transport system permease protein
MNYLLHLLIYIDIYVIVALSLNIVVGYLGLLNLAHSAYFALGGYAYALAALKMGWGIIPGILLAVGLAVVLSFALSLSSWRFGGDFFVLISLAVQACIFSGLYNWSSPYAPVGSFANLTNGPFGLAGIPRPSVFLVKLDSLGEVAILSCGCAGLCAFVSWRFITSPWGRLLKAIRDDELVARGLGKNVRLAKVQAFAIASGLVAVAGSLYASYVGYIDPSAASLDESVLMLAMIVVGGVGNFRGPIVGALVLLAIPEGLRFLKIPDEIAANVRLLLFGLLLSVLMHLRPEGLAGEYRMR